MTLHVTRVNFYINILFTSHEKQINLESDYEQNMYIGQSDRSSSLEKGSTLNNNNNNYKKIFIQDNLRQNILFYNGS